jgi:D-methionine transport system ATP-binding protein
MIKITNITKKYKNNDDEIALKDVTASFEAGKIHGIIGTSGAGKSTLIRLFNKLETYDKGDIEIFDYKNLKALNKESTRMLRKEIGMIFQTDHLLSRKTVLSNVLLPISLHRKITKKDIIHAKDLLNEVGLSNYAERYPSQLSGGQKQRVGIARALINDPKLLLCDEPTSALDIITTGNILQLIKEVAHNHNVNVIIVTHDMNVVKEICDTVTVMENGKIVESGDLDDILFKAKHPQTKAFIKNTGFDITSILNTYNSKELLLLRFDKNIVQDSIISKMTNGLQVNSSIIYANITPHSIGVMLIHVPNHQKIVKEYLEKQKVVVEYVI